MNSFILRARGFHVVMIYACLLLFLAIGLLGNLSDLHNYGQVDWTPFLMIGSSLVLVGIFFAWTFIKTKIVIGENRLSIYPVQKFEQKIVLSFPFFYSTSYPVDYEIENIQSIFIGEMGKIEEQLKNSQSLQVKSFYGFHRNTTLGFGSSIPSIFIRIPRWVTAKHMPIMFIATKDPQNSLLVSAKPFTRRGLQRFVTLIKDEGVGVTTEKYLGLE